VLPLVAIEFVPEHREGQPKGYTRHEVTAARAGRSLIFFVVIEIEVGFVVVVVSDLERGSGLCEVQAIGGRFDVTDDFGCVGFGVEAGGIVRGQLKAVKQRRGAAGVELSSSQGIDDDREGNLYGLAIFKGGQLDVLAGDQVAA
jgi:hypothetical protein